MPRERVELPGLRLQSLGGEHSTAKLDLALYMDEGLTSLRGGFEYARDLFDRETIGRLVGRFDRLLNGIISDPTRRCTELPDRKSVV